MGYIGKKNFESANTESILEFIATAGQTTFTVGYSIGHCEVFKNGLKLKLADFTANNGTSVVLTLPASLNDVIQIKSQSVKGLVDAYSTVQVDGLLNNKAPLANPTFTGTPTIDGLNLSPYIGNNLLINSNKIRNQRAYESGTATTVANQYTVDRWRVVTLGQNLTFSTTLGLTTFTAPAGGVEQVIEDLNILGGSYVLSFTGTATALVSQSSDNVTYTTVTPSAGVYTITGGYYVRVRFSSGTFSKAKFELGTVATPYEPNSYTGELMACLRYFEFINTSRRAGRAPSTTNILFEPVHLLVQKRVVPTLVVTKYDTPSGYTSVGTLVAAYSGNSFYQVQDITAVGLTAGTIASALISITLDAEL